MFDKPEETGPEVTHYIVTDMENSPVFQSNFRSACEEWAEETGKLAEYRLYKWNPHNKEWGYIAGHSLAFD